LIRPDRDFVTQPGEAGTKNFGGKSEARNSYRGRRPTSGNPKQLLKNPNSRKRKQAF
jgi:hypothetical protein